MTVRKKGGEDKGKKEGEEKGREGMEEGRRGLWRYSVTFHP